MSMKNAIFSACLAILLSALSAPISRAHDFGGQSNSNDGDPPEDEPCEPSPYWCCLPQGGTGGSGGGGSGNSHSEKPISYFNGSESFLNTDLVVQGQFPIRIVRKYHSQSRFDSAVGFGWALLLERGLYEYPDGSIIVRNTCGRRDKFVFSGGAFSSPVSGTRATLVATQGGHELRYANGVIDNYDNLGRLVSVRDARGNSHEYTYDVRGKLPLVGTTKNSVDPNQPIVTAYAYRISRVDERGANGAATGRFVTFQYNDSTGRLTSVTANDGRRVEYLHDTVGSLTSGNLLQVNMLDGQVASYGYADPNDPHNVTSIVEASGRTPIVNTYDAQDRVVMQTEGTRKIQFNYQTPFVRTVVTRTIVDDAGQNAYTSATTYEFNSAGSTTKVVSPLGHETRFDYNPSNYLTKREIWQKTGSTLSLLQRMEWTYDVSGHRLSEFVTLDSGETVTRTWTYDHDWIASDQIVSTAAPQKIFRTEFTFFYGTDGRPVGVQSQKRRKDDGSFQTTSFTYDSRNRILSTTLPDGVKQVNEYTGDFVSHTYFEVAGSPIAAKDARFEFNSEGRLIKQWDAGNNLTQFSYDGHGRLISRKNALGEEEVWTYTGGLLTQVERGRTASDGEGQIVKYLRDSRGRITHVQRKDDAGSFVTFRAVAYDSEDRSIRVTDANGRVTATTYDLNGRVSSTTDPLGKQTFYFYDAADNRTLVRDALNRDVDIEYDDLNRMIATVESAIAPSARTELGYDAVGNLTSVRDAENRVTTYSFDSLGRVASLTRPLGQQSLFSFDARDRIQRVITARGQKIEYEYEPWGGLKREAHFATASSSVAEADIAYGFDNHGNVTSISDSRIQSGHSFDITYDPLGRRFDETVKYIPGGDRVLQHRYNRFGNRTQLNVVGAGGANHSYSFDKLDRLTSATLAGSVISMSHFANDDLQSVSLPNGVTQAYTYRANGPIESIDIGGPSGQIAAFGYVYDDATNVLSQTDPDGTHSYLYDGANRLTQATHPITSGLPAVENFAYTSAGDRKDPGNLSAWSYDANHRLLGSPGLTYGFDDSGNLVSRSDSASLSFDARQRLVQFSKSGISTTYLYEPMGRRIRKSTGSSATWFLWDGLRLLLEFDASGARTKRYGYLSGDTPAQLEDLSGTYYVHADHLGSPRLLTGSGAQVVWRARASAYGDANTLEDPDGNSIPVTFNARLPGQYFDVESGFHYNMFRDYDPKAGRYIESDPLTIGEHAVQMRESIGASRVQPQSLSEYGYSLGNPTNFIDPTGLVPGGLPPTGDCKPSEWRFCDGFCSPNTTLGCYVTIKWRIGGVRGGEPIRGEERKVNCRCSHPEDDPVPACGTGCKTAIVAGIVILVGCTVMSGGSSSPATGPAIAAGLGALAAAQ